MPRPKRIKNLVKPVAAPNSDPSVGNYVQINETSMTAQQQPTPPSLIPHSASPLPQDFRSSPPQTSQNVQPQNSNLQTAESAHREIPFSIHTQTSESVEPQSSN